MLGAKINVALQNGQRSMSHGERDSIVASGIIQNIDHVRMNSLQTKRNGLEHKRWIHHDGQVFVYWRLVDADSVHLFPLAQLWKVIESQFGVWPFSLIRNSK